jgi:NAD(P)H dehydrogenase (quinone)
MHVLIVYAHQEQLSFSCALKDMAVSVLESQGHSVEVSDLYAQHFNPVASREDFTTLSDPHYINYMLEQRTAAEHGYFSQDIRAEQDKVRRADLIMFHFPVWWFSVPAILKGWFDRVFVTGVTWNFGHIYDAGLLKGKKAMLVVTTGGGEDLYQIGGAHKATILQILHPVQHGTLRFCAMEVLPPFVAFGIFQAGEEGRKKYLEEFRIRLSTLETTLPMDFLNKSHD